jgi:hypothetical protein
MKKLLVGVVIGGLLTAFCFWKLQPQPSPAKVIENPNPLQKQQAAAVLTEQRQGTITGRVVVSQAPQTEKTSADGSRDSLSLPIGAKYSAPVTGKVKTVYLRSGQKVAEGEHPISGETTVTVGQAWLDIQTQFGDTVAVAVDLPDPPKATWHWGGYLLTDGERVGWGGYGQKDFLIQRIGKVDVLAVGRVQVDWDRRIYGGIEVNW